MLQVTICGKCQCEKPALHTLFMCEEEVLCVCTRESPKKGAMSSMYCYVSMQLLRPQLWWSPLESNTALLLLPSSHSQDRRLRSFPPLQSNPNAKPSFSRMMPSPQPRNSTMRPSGNTTDSRGSSSRVPSLTRPMVTRWNRYSRQKMLETLQRS